MNLLFIYLLLLLLFLRRYINESHNKQKQKRTLNLTIYCMHVSKSKNVNQFNVILLKKKKVIFGYFFVTIINYYNFIVFIYVRLNLINHFVRFIPCQICLYFSN